MVIDKELCKNALHLIDNWLDFQTFIKEIPGIAVGIFIDDEIVFQKEYGYANLETKTKLTEKHLFRIASHSKLFTATAIMKLYSEDKLSIDDRISKHLPWFVSAKDKNLKDIRIRHLLTHSSGMTRDGITAHWSTHKFPSIEEIKKQVKEGISFFDASENLKYSNFGFTVLGQIVEEVSGQKYAEYIQDKILAPLEMTNTFTDVNESNIEHHSIGYSIKYPKKERKPFEHVQAKIMDPATGFSSNVSDLIQFYKGHFLGNNTLFSDFIKREMQRTHFKTEKVERGLGFGIIKIGKKKFAGHGGGYPGFITRSGLIQDEKVILVVLTNTIDGPAETLLTGIYKILEHVMDNKAKYFDEDIEQKSFKEIEGFYESEWGISLFSQIGKKLVLVGPSAANPVEFIKILKHKEEFIFINPSKPVYASPKEEIQFQKDSSGEMVFIDSHKGRNPRFKFSY